MLSTEIGLMVVDKLVYKIEEAICVAKFRRTEDIKEEIGNRYEVKNVVNKRIYINQVQ